MKSSDRSATRSAVAGSRAFVLVDFISAARFTRPPLPIAEIVQEWSHKVLSCWACSCSIALANYHILLTPGCNEFWCGSDGDFGIRVCEQPRKSAAHRKTGWVEEGTPRSRKTLIRNSSIPRDVEAPETHPPRQRFVHPSVPSPAREVNTTQQTLKPEALPSACWQCEARLQSRARNWRREG